MKINKSKAFKKQKSKRGGGGKVTLKPVPENFFKSRGIYPSQHMSPSYKLVQSPRMSPSYKLVQSLTRPIPVQPFNRSLSQNPRHSLSISPITFDSEYVHKTDRIYNSFSPKPKSRSSNRNSQSSPNATSRQGSPNATSRQGSPNATSRQGSPKGTSSQGSPNVIARHNSPNATSRQGSPKGTSRHDSPKVIARHNSPNATSRQGSPKATSNDGIIIKRPILSYDKVNQRDLLIYLDTCNSEYKSFEKNYYDNYKIKIHRDSITYFTRINTEYYQYALSYNGFIRFARSLLNTGDNLQQDHDVEAKKKELRDMLNIFEEYLTGKDRIYNPELKETLDMTKEIVNKINALYGSKLRQSYLRKITKIGEKMKGVPGKLWETTVATAQNLKDFQFSKNTNPHDRIGKAIFNYQRRTAAASAKAKRK